MLKTSKTNTPRVPEKGRMSLFANEAGEWNSIDEAGVTTPLGGSTLPLSLVLLQTGIFTGQGTNQPVLSYYETLNPAVTPTLTRNGPGEYFLSHGVDEEPYQTVFIEMTPSDGFNLLDGLMMFGADWQGSGGISIHFAKVDANGGASVDHNYTFMYRLYGFPVQD